MNTKDPRHTELMAILTKKVLANPDSTIDVELQTTGTILLNNGIQDFAAKLGEEVKIEPAEDENGPFAFLVVTLDGIEILQIDEDWTPPEDDG